MKPTVLILCTGNSCRSHLAEGILRAAAGDLLDVQSAGSKPAGYVHPLAVRVMKELGIDISSHRSKHLNEFMQRPVETVITVCGNADQACPIFPGQVNRYHWGFDDPAHAIGTEEEKLAVFRRVRDEIKKVFEAYAAGRKAQLFLKAQHADAVGCEERAGQAATSFMKTTAMQTSEEDIRKAVREGYGAIARSGGSCCGSTPGSCGSSPEGSESLARHVGYSPEELAVLPAGANMGLSCGNPNALAFLRPGEIVLDLGSGGGFDVFIAGRKVGPTGRVIGVDMTAEMLAKARKNTGAYRQSTGLDNVEFRLGEIEHLPVEDGSIDVIISNCVINLSPDKPQVWREIARVLKPGGRVAVSDLALLRPLPPSILESVQALVGCVAGAVLVSETEQMAKAAGLSQVLLKTKSDYINGMVDWQDPLYQQIIASLPAGTKPGDFITSLEVTARKAGNPAELQDTVACCSSTCCETEVDPAPVQSAGRSE